MRTKEREETVLKKHARIVNLIMIVCPFSSGNISSQRYKLRSERFCDLHHTFSAALSLERCLWRTTDSQG